MSTRGYIIVQVRESAKGKSLSFDRSMLSPDIRILDDQKWNGDGFDPLTEVCPKPYQANHLYHHL